MFVVSSHSFMPENILQAICYQFLKICGISVCAAAKI